MTLTDLVSSSAVAPGLAPSLTSGKAATQAASAVPAKSAALPKTEISIQGPADSSSTRVSSIGKLKSAVSEVQLASRALLSLTSTTSSASVKLAAGSLVTAYNNAMQAARSAAATAGTGSDSASARRAGRELLQSVTADVTTLASLKKLGISVLPDGTLTLDSKTLDSAQLADRGSAQAALGTLATRLDQSATQELTRDALDKSRVEAMISPQSGFGAYGLAAYLK